MNQKAEERLLLEILTKSPIINAVLERAPQLGTPNWYLGAGCLAQTVWNHYHGYNLTAQIKDCDLVYFDEDLSEEKEALMENKGKQLFSDIPIAMDIVNQARVHLWYAETFGYSIEPYRSIEHALSTWPTTATSVAITYDEPQAIHIIAPYGLTDLLNMIVRANKVQITEAIYNKKIERWIKAWPQLKIIPWNNS